MIAPRSFAGVSLGRPRIMGIVNVTPDSVSDGGTHFDTSAAIEGGRNMAAAGADFLDIGGESTRPGAEPIGIDEELRRVLPVIEALRETGKVISVDTRHPDVMRAAVEAGAQVINDVTALSHHPDSIATAAGLGVPVILMHMLTGDPRTMQDDPHYDDAPVEIRDYLTARAAACEDAGIAPADIAIDPGIGFGKTVTHNLQILKRMEVLTATGYPVVIGVSRKGFIGKLSGEPMPANRVPGSIAAGLAAVARGAHILRVHDVPQTVQALALWQSVKAVDA